MAKSAHDQAAGYLSKKFRIPYQRDEGADLQGRIVVEVEKDPNKISDAKRQLQGHKNPRYIAATNEVTLNAALEGTKNTKIGVMDKRGKIIKRAKAILKRR